MVLGAKLQPILILTAAILAAVLYAINIPFAKLLLAEIEWPQSLELLKYWRNDVRNSD